MAASPHAFEQLIQIPIGDIRLEGTLTIPDRASGLVVFAHGSGSSRHSPRNRYVAELLQRVGLATLLMDLLSPEEDEIDGQTSHLRFDIGGLGDRVVRATDWLRQNPDTRNLAIGYFGASTGAAAALVAASQRPDIVKAVVSRGGRPDLSGDALSRVRAPTLLLVGGNDTPVISMNRSAMEQMENAQTQLEIVPGATHLFEEPGQLDDVALAARDWFNQYLTQVFV